MADLSSNPARLNLTIYHGRTDEVVLTWPAGVLDGRGPWQATVTGPEDGDVDPIDLPVDVVGDVMTLDVPALDKALKDVTLSWELADAGRPIIGGRFTVSILPGPSTIEATVTIDEQTVMVELVGGLESAPVESVNGEIGEVVLDAADVGADPAGSAATVQTALDGLEDTLVRPAMTVVAASDAPAEMLARADVVCSGTDDQVEISAALVDGDVQLTSGTYSVGDTGDPFILAATDDRWLRGCGPSTLIRLAPRDRAAGPENFGVIEVRGEVGTPVRRVRVSDLAIDGNRTAHTGTAPGHPMDWGEGCNIVNAEQVGVWNLTVTDANADGIDFDDSSDCWAHSLHVSGSGGWGVHISLGTTRTRVSGCTIAECGQAAGQERGGFDVTTSDNIVQDMIVRDCNNLTAFVTGDRQLVANVHATSTPGVLCEGNAFLPSDGCSLVGFRMDGTGAPTGPTVGDGPLQLGPGSTTNTLVQGWRTTGFADPIDDQAIDTRLVQCATDDGVSEQSGTATIADTATTEVVSHGLFGTPSVVTVTPRGGELVWVSARTATTFTLERAGSSGALAVDWSAHV